MYYHEVQLQTPIYVLSWRKLMTPTHVLYWHKVQLQKPTYVLYWHEVQLRLLLACDHTLCTGKCTDGICTVVHAKQKKRNQNLDLKESSTVYSVHFTRHVYTENVLKIYLRL